MTILVCAVLLLLTGLNAFMLGRRWERGRTELEDAALEERAFQRSGRASNMKLTTMKIRR